MPSLIKPSAIIFDWDNTLVDTWPVIHTALNATMEAMQKPLWTYDMTKQRVRKSMRDSFPEIFGEHWEEAGKVYQQQYRSNHLNTLQPLPEAEPVLQAIQALGLYCVVVSNKKGNTLREEVTHLGWDHYFASVVGSDDAARDKPYCEPVHLAFDKSPHVLSEQVWFVGDSDIDLECARNAGCTAVLYGAAPHEHGEFTATHFQSMPYHAHVIDHTQLMQLLKASGQ